MNAKIATIGEIDYITSEDGESAAAGAHGRKDASRRDDSKAAESEESG